MSVYTDNYKLKSGVPSLQEQIEVSIVNATNDIKNEGDAAPNHANRMVWAVWANSNTAAARVPFGWPVAMNPAIQANYATDPSGGSIPDSDVQFVVNANVDAVIADFVANPPPNVTIPAA